jgi:tRNA threonylcarbamoyladenosine biosynthesis protein TsaB
LRLLAIETATPCVACALWSDDGPVGSFMLVARQRHAEVLMPAVDELCRQAEWSVADLTAVAVDRGPGLFTGLRVGLATARAISDARGIPAVGVTSLDVLAHSVRRRAGLVASVVDARRGEVYWALYRADGTEARELRSAAVAAPEALAGQLTALDGPVLAVGDGASRYEDLFTRAGATIGTGGEMWPSALALAQLAADQLGVDPIVASGPLTPLYLRQADVRIGWDQVGGRTNGQTDGPGPDRPAPDRPAADRPAADRPADDIGAAAVSSSQGPKLAP